MHSLFLTLIAFGIVCVGSGLFALRSFSLVCLIGACLLAGLGWQVTR